MTFAALQPLADRAALFVALRQDALSAAADALGEHRWDADLAAGTLTFTADADPSRQLVARAHLIATIAPGPRSLLWGLGAPERRRTGCRRAAAGLRQRARDRRADCSRGAVPRRGLGRRRLDRTGRAHGRCPSRSSSPTLPLLLRPGRQRNPCGVRARCSAGTSSPWRMRSWRCPVSLSGISHPDARTSVWDLARLAGWTLALDRRGVLRRRCLLMPRAPRPSASTSRARISGIESTLYAQG